jgi:hypothetical protein
VVAILLGVLIGALGGIHLLLSDIMRSHSGEACRVVVLSGYRRECIILNVALSRRVFRRPRSVRLVARVSGGLLVSLVVICPPVLQLGVYLRRWWVLCMRQRRRRLVRWPRNGARV